ncbi:hypothetical protein NX059_007400 [Plenodomus lindquistii]|nr:hypothetical protein NX059_007400 [Plenodomus lindquistii]
MRFNAIIAATILAVTVSGAAVPKPAAAPAVTGDEITAADIIDFVADQLDEGDFVKREAEADPKSGSHPVGFTPNNKREADPKKVSKHPVGFTPNNKREADPKKVSKHPVGFTPNNKREADPKKVSKHPVGFTPNN